MTGNPRGPEFLHVDRATARRELGADDRPLILSVGGSLGAARVNAAMAEVLARSAKDGRFQHIHATGSAGWESTRARLRELGVPEDAPGITVREYIDDMPRCMAAADLVVSRCGAMTLSELPAAGKPAILIPSPNVAENHQFHNAMALVKKGAAVCLEEKDLTAERLWGEIEKLASSPGELRRMAENARKDAILDADDRIYAVVESVMKNGGRWPG